MAISPHPGPADADPDTTPPTRRPGADARVRTTAALVVAAIALLGIGAWAVGGGNHGRADERAAGDGATWAGRVLDTPRPKPDLHLTDTSGRPYDLRTATAGRLTLLMFGYTSCPDVCPISLATLRAALEELDPEVAHRVQLVFVTADPARDTPDALRTYLDGFDPRFVGLTGSQDEVDAAQRLADVPVATRSAADPDGDYTVGHATQLIAYQADDTARIVYPFGTRQQDWIRDLPRLVAGEVPRR